MNIEFEDEALKELFITGVTENKYYKRLPSDIVKRYIKVVNYLKAAERGVIVNAILKEISKHYE